MGVISWLQSKFFKGSLKDCGQFYSDELLECLQDYYIRRLAYYSAVNMIANAVSKCEFKTYSEGKEVREREYYAWNYSPNQNQSSSVFIHKWISKMLGEQYEALIIERAGQLLVADGFCYEPQAVAEVQFTDIWVEGLEINTYFRQRDAMYFRPSFENMRQVIEGLSISYSKLISAAAKDYQWKSGRHGIINVQAVQNGSAEWQEKYKELLNNHLKPFLTQPNSVLPEYMGFVYRELETGSRTQTTTRDIKALVDDIFEFTARGFCIPGVLLKGEVENTGDALDRFLTFCIDPLCDQLQEEITRKRYGYEGFRRGDFLRIDTTKIKHFDLFGNATNVDKLISSGAFSINEIRAAAGEDRIDEAYADEHFITKNYITVQDMAALGGEDNQENVGA